MRRRAWTSALTALTLVGGGAACGRLGFADSTDGTPDVTDDGPPGPDASPLPDAAPTPDATPPGPMTVTNTGASGPGSLSAAIAYLNSNCGALGPGAAIDFRIPLDDPGHITLDGGNRVWRIAELTETVPACPGAVIDGTTQTAFGGDTNPAQVGGMAVGAAGVPLPLIDGPEIELRGIGLTLGADGMTVRGLALGSLGSNSDDLTIEGCWFGSEPQVPFALPAELRAGTNTLLYLADVGGTQGHTISRNVFVWSIGMTNQYNGLAVGSSGPSVIRDNYMIGSGGGSVWDELHLNPALELSVTHNYIAGTSWSSTSSGSTAPAPVPSPRTPSWVPWRRCATRAGPRRWRAATSSSSGPGFGQIIVTVAGSFGEVAAGPTHATMLIWPGRPRGVSA
jgi:hypothetical protein